MFFWYFTWKKRSMNTQKQNVFFLEQSRAKWARSRNNWRWSLNADWKLVSASQRESFFYKKTFIHVIKACFHCLPVSKKERCFLKNYLIIISLFPLSFQFNVCVPHISKNSSKSAYLLYYWHWNILFTQCFRYFTRTHAHTYETRK